MLKRISDQNYEIDFNGTPRVVMTELLKPAHIIPEDLAIETPGNAQPVDQILSNAGT